MAMLGLCSFVSNFVFSMFFLLLCHGDTFVVTQEEEEEERLFGKINVH